VIGGGNILRPVTEWTSQGDYMGMLYTVINGMA
jgi:uridylate kinase